MIIGTAACLLRLLRKGVII